MTSDASGGVKTMPYLRRGTETSGGASSHAVRELLPGDAVAEGVWGDLLQASPWSNRPFKGLRDTPILSFAEAETLVPPHFEAPYLAPHLAPPHLSEEPIWDANWAGVETDDAAALVNAAPEVETVVEVETAVEVEATVEVEAAVVVEAIVEVETAVVVEAVVEVEAAPEVVVSDVIAEDFVQAAAQDVTKEIAQSEVPVIETPKIVVEVVSPGKDFSAVVLEVAGIAKKPEVKNAASLPPVKPISSRGHEVPVENLLTGVANLVGSGAVNAAGLAAFAGASVASVLGFGAKKGKAPAAKSDATKSRK